MKRHNNLGLRGHIWWWRKKVRISSLSVPLAFSLQTTDIKRARWLRDKLNARCAELIMAYGVVPDTMTEDQAKRVFIDAMKSQLERVLRDTPRDGQYLQEHLYANEAFGVIHQIMADNVPLTKAGEALALQAQRRGWPLDAYNFAYQQFNLLVQHPDVSGHQLDCYARVHGIKRTTTNDDRMITEIRAARSRACFQVNEMLKSGQWTRDQWVDEAIASASQPFDFEAQPSETVAPASEVNAATPADGQGSVTADGNGNGAHDTETGAAHQSFQAVAVESTAGVPVSAPVQPAPTAPDLQPQQDTAPVEAISPTQNGNWTIKMLVEQVIEDVYVSAGKTEAAVQMRTFAKMLYHVMGGPDALATSLQQTHVGGLMDLMNRLPSRWGRTRAELAGGIAASLERAASLPAEDVGVTAVTKAKHLTYFATLLEHGPDLVAIPKLNLAPSHKKIAPALQQQTQGRARIAWTIEEITQLLDTPPFTGCAGPERFQRYLPGVEYYHDSAYWMPLACPLWGPRSSEFGGLALDDVFENAPIPYIWIRPNEFRGLKNAASARKVPIPPELLRLGFREFVAAVRKAAARNQNVKCLFSDLLPQSTQADFAGNYLKSFELLRGCAFPFGTSALRRVKGANKDKDVHSFRHTFVTELYYSGVNEAIIQSLVGHCTDLADIIPELKSRKKSGSETTRKYRGEASLKIMLHALENISHITSHLVPFDIRLNPVIYGEVGE